MYRLTRSDAGMESPLLTRRAMWCGVVSALAVLITALNLLPPLDVSYRVRGELVVSEARLAQLRTTLKYGKLPAAAEGGPVELLRIAVLDRSTIPAMSQSKTGKVVLLKITSRWLHRCTPAEHAQWLRHITDVPSPPASLSSELSKQHRFARWELTAAQHYLQQHQYQHDGSPDAFRPIANLEGNAEASAPGDGVPASFATFARPAGLKPSLGGDPQFVTLQLNDAVQKAEERLQQAENTWKQQFQQAAGFLQVASLPKIAAESGSMPLWMSASVLILGLCAGSTAGWLQFRLHSGGLYEAAAVAQQLAKLGIPLVGQMSVPGHELASGDWIDTVSRKASQTGRKAARHLTRVAEVTLALWVILIVCRVIGDGMWRSVFWDSPLAAFGRLLLGMP